MSMCKRYQLNNDKAQKFVEFEFSVKGNKQAKEFRKNNKIFANSPIEEVVQLLENGIVLGVVYDYPESTHNKWAVETLNYPNLGYFDVHVIPLQDIEEHKRESSCKCQPTIEVYGSNLLVVHNSFDMREIVEEAIEYIMKGAK